MKLALAQLNYHIGNFEANEKKIIDAISEAKENGADLVVFAELSICGYPPRDFLQFEDFIVKCDESLTRIASHCHGIAAIVGSPSLNKKKKGKSLHNSAYFLKDGKIESVHHKQLLPTYDVFDENRYFEPAKDVQCINYKGKKIALTICEDLWNMKGDFLYRKSPMKELSDEQPDFIINIAASPFHTNQQAERQKVFAWNSTFTKPECLF